uniref:Uncharacterized protein n=1 Tax=Cacopsylla melanoneura TaxID=428564 RepID=A0A8D8VLB1_9HEMI
MPSFSTAPRGSFSISRKSSAVSISSDDAAAAVRSSALLTPGSRRESRTLLTPTSPTDSRRESVSRRESIAKSFGSHLTVGSGESSGGKPPGRQTSTGEQETSVVKSTTTTTTSAKTQASSDVVSSTSKAETQSSSSSGETRITKSKIPSAIPQSTGITRAVLQTAKELASGLITSHGSDVTPNDVTNDPDDVPQLSPIRLSPDFLDLGMLILFLLLAKVPRRYHQLEW